ncbi:glia maturation factor gamma-like [Acanthaster planci]|uniref:Glia maturation factor gamma-like n=1 Tax=Acanthaster planci TaxID=133434 RepID=A0A8B7YEQ5_ACAPL|nr:glia maturation factor gamma-like [Acanthaster planci]
MASGLTVCTIDDEVKEKLKKFRFRQKKTNAALIFKILEQKVEVVLDEEFDDISVDELQAELPSAQPRYVYLSYCYKHSDGRVSYPLIFIFISPIGCKPELQMMYAGTKNSLVGEAGATKVFELRSTEELTEEYLLEKLAFFR